MNGGVYLIAMLVILGVATSVPALLVYPPRWLKRK